MIKGIELKQVEYVDLTKDNRISKKEKIDTTKDDLIILGAPVYVDFCIKSLEIILRILILIIKLSL